MQPDSSNLLSMADITVPLIGFYDAPSISQFEPIVEPDNKQCIFAFYQNWLNGQTLHITKERFGCGGAGNHLCNIPSMSRKDFLKFLVDGEGLKASYDLMNQWLDTRRPYKQVHSHLLLGPLKKGMYDYCKTITFFVNPDQLGALILGSQYNATPDDMTMVSAPFGSGCMQLAPLFKNHDIAQALIGATDIAMRQYLPPDILAFTVTKPMFKQLCELDEKSFLYKPFWKRLRKARGLIN